MRGTRYMPQITRRNEPNLRPAGAERQLGGRVGLQDELGTRARLPRDHLRHASTQPHGEVHEDRHHGVPWLERIWMVDPVGEVHVPGLQLDALLGSQRLGLVECDAGEVEADDAVALLGEVHAVASLAVAQAQHAGAGLEQPGLVFQEVVGPVAVEVVGVRVAVIPEL